MKTFDQFWAEFGAGIAWNPDSKDAARRVWLAARAGMNTDNEAAFDHLLHDSRQLAQQDADAFGIGYVVDGQRVAPHRVQVFVPATQPQPQGQDRGIELAFMGVPPGRCLHEFDCDFAGAHWSIWRCRHCGAERRR